MKSYVFGFYFILFINAYEFQKSAREYLTPLLPLDDGHKFPSIILNPASSRIKNDCVCTPFHLCKTFVLSTTPFDATDTDGKYQAKPKKCLKSLEICCDDTILIGENKQMKQSYETSTTYDPFDLSDQSTNKWNHNIHSTEIYSENKYENSNKEEFDFKKEHDTHYKSKKCGIWNEYGFGIGLGGATDYTARYGEFPSTIVIYVEEILQNWKKSLKYQCGGSLIKENVILTAAHCIINKDLQSILVRAGDWDLNTEKELYLHQDRHISKVVIHHKYYSGGLHNDIALIFTDEPFTLQENVQIMCLPKQDQIFDYIRCYSSGWGETDKRKISKMKKIEVPIVPRDLCEDRLRQTRLGYKFNLHESFICAGGEGEQDTCKVKITYIEWRNNGYPKYFNILSEFFLNWSTIHKPSMTLVHTQYLNTTLNLKNATRFGWVDIDNDNGDGGSPLMCPSETGTKSLIQAGIVSWGIGCGIKNIPAAYVNVANFRNWIDGEIET